MLYVAPRVMLEIGRLYTIPSKQDFSKSGIFKKGGIYTCQMTQRQIEKGPVTNPRRQVECVDQQCPEATPLIVAKHDDIHI